MQISVFQACGSAKLSLRSLRKFSLRELHKFSLCKISLRRISVEVVPFKFLAQFFLRKFLQVLHERLSAQVLDTRPSAHGCDFRAWGPSLPEAGAQPGRQTVKPSSKLQQPVSPRARAEGRTGRGDALNALKVDQIDRTGVPQSSKKLQRLIVDTS